MLVAIDRAASAARIEREVEALAAPDSTLGVVTALEAEVITNALLEHREKG